MFFEAKCSRGERAASFDGTEAKKKERRKKRTQLVNLEKELAVLLPAITYVP